MSDPITIEGIVEEKSVKDRRTPYGEKKATSFKINGEWYSGGFKHWDVDQGDEVSLTYVTNDKGYKDVKGCAVKAKGAGAPPPANTGVRSAGRSFPVDPLAPERTINRQNALTAAVAFCNHSAPPGECLPEDVISVARIFEAYTTGDVERLAAEEINSHS